MRECPLRVCLETRAYLAPTRDIGQVPRARTAVIYHPLSAALASSNYGEPAIVSSVPLEAFLYA